MTATSAPIAALAAEPAQHRHRWTMLAVLLLGQFMALLDVTIVNVAVPGIGADLHTSGASLQLVVAGYTTSYAAGLITGARLGDLYGRRRMYLAGALGFTVMSLLCGFAPDVGVLIGARIAQGAAAAVMVPQIMSVIQMRFAGPARAGAVGAYGAVLALGAVAGMVLGGVLVNADLAGLGWRVVFLVNVPLGAALLALVPRLVPVDQPTARRRLDIPGLCTAAAAISLVVVPLVLGRQLAWPAWSVLCVVTGVALALAFVAWEVRAKGRGGDPLLDFTVLTSLGLRPGLLSLIVMQVGYGAFLFTFTVHLQSGLGDSALRTGLI